eukprot:827278-Rhodomonas_salina.5
MLLRLCYGMPGTDLGYAATRRQGAPPAAPPLADFQVQKKLPLPYALPVLPLRNAQYWHHVRCYALSGTERGRGGTRRSCEYRWKRRRKRSRERGCYELRGTELVLRGIRVPVLIFGHMGAREEELERERKDEERLKRQQLKVDAFLDMACWYGRTVSCYARAMACPVLIWAMVLPGGA